MNHKDYQELIQFTRIGEELTPIANHLDLINELEDGEIAFMKRFNARDLNMHKAYFVLLKEVYKYLPNSFQRTIPLKKFYKFLQTLKGDYEVLFQFEDGTKLLEYESISFGRMDENKFRDYIKNQIPFIYENIIMRYYDFDQSRDIINNIESEFEKYLTKLFSKY